MEDIDADISNGLKWVLEAPNVEQASLTYSVYRYYAGQAITVDLIPRGRETSVIQENKLDYANELAKYIMTTEISQQIAAFKNGFNDVLPLKHLQALTSKDLG